MAGEAPAAMAVHVREVRIAYVGQTLRVTRDTLRPPEGFDESTFLVLHRGDMVLATHVVINSMLLPVGELGGVESAMAGYLFIHLRARPPIAGLH